MGKARRKRRAARAGPDGDGLIARARGTRGSLRGAHKDVRPPSGGSASDEVGGRASRWKPWGCGPPRRFRGTPPGEGNERKAAATRRVLVLMGFRPSFGRPGAFWSCAKGTKTRWRHGWTVRPAAGFPGGKHREPGEPDLGLRRKHLVRSPCCTGPCCLLYGSAGCLAFTASRHLPRGGPERRG